MRGSTTSRLYLPGKGFITLYVNTDSEYKESETTMKKTLSRAPAYYRLDPLFHFGAVRRRVHTIVGFIHAARVICSGQRPSRQYRTAHCMLALWRVQGGFKTVAMHGSLWSKMAKFS